MKLETLNDLFYEELRELYDEEGRLVKALPQMAKNSSSQTLREAFEKHLAQTREHVTRLEECFRDLGKQAGHEPAKGIKGLIQDGERIIDDIDQSPLRDAALIGAAKRVEHYEIAAYSGTISFARMLGREKIASLLEQTLHEEEQADRKLSEIAESTVNQEALQLGAHQREYSMSPKAHTRKVMARATEKKAKSPFRCEQCGKTFVSESERKAHDKSQHSTPRTKRAV